MTHEACDKAIDKVMDDLDAAPGSWRPCSTKLAKSTIEKWYRDGE